MKGINKRHTKTKYERHTEHALLSFVLEMNLKQIMTTKNITGHKSYCWQSYLKVEKLDYMET
jgi:hypothetical protein